MASTYSVAFKYDTDNGTELTKTFSGYNADVTDAIIRACGKALADNQIFEDEDGNPIVGLTQITRIERNTTDVPVESVE